MYIKTLSVSALNNYIKKTIDSDFILNNVSIKGEISNFKMHSSGHLYFSLKDEGSKINCIMFRSYTANLKFLPKDGESVIIKGKVSVYEKDGAYQLYCHEMTQAGLGELYAAFQEMKNKLEKAGLFDLEHKKAIPKFPRRIGVVTSPTGAAIRDIINVSTRRNRGVDILIYPALVQGESASADLIRGIEALNKIDDIDVIILARGGGSLEELWAFNNEKLAYAIFNSKKPIVTGVGHETDFTIADFVSDRRAPTPSAAAEIVVIDMEEMIMRVESYRYNFESSLTNVLKNHYNKVKMLKRTLQAHSPMNFIIHQYNYIDNFQDKLGFKIKSKILSEKENLNKYYSILNAHNPLKVLSKGYAVVEDFHGKVISEVAQLKNKDEIKLTLKDGSVRLGIDSVSDL